jgi:phospholipase/carboxylesterase
VQDAVLGIHFAHHAKQVLDGLGLPLSYHEYQGGHSLSSAMAGDFLQWLGAQLDAPK